jgi:hypothetical protein
MFDKPVVVLAVAASARESMLQVAEADSNIQRPYDWALGGLPGVKSGFNTGIGSNEVLTAQPNRAYCVE